MNATEIIDLIEAVQDTLREYVSPDDDGDLEMAARAAVQYLIDNGLVESED